MSVLDAQSTNARATFYVAAEGSVDDPYEDPDSDWDALHEDVPVLWDPHGTEFVNTETGDQLRREDRVFAPLELANDHSAGDRVDITPEWTDQVYRLRIVGGADRTFDGQMGYWQITVRRSD